MNPITRPLSVAVFLSVLSILPLVSRAEGPVASDDFSGSALSEKWNVAKGAWTITDGKLKGVELASDKHAAVATYVAPHTNSKVKLSFQLAGSDGFHLSFNHEKGHLFRVIVTSKDATLTTDKDKKDPASKAVQLCKVEGAFEQGKTYTVTCETKGDSVTAEFDNGVKLSGSDPSLATKKTGYRLVVKGEGVLFDDFAVLTLE
ncbi:MAG: hypothetical protein H7A53_04705 [Akkermansiaceae bacterium]|nr:hypothetical protein [Akkermansiaceae bacterium]MCP5550175.1 hypothetical protein [Akkermansiaceae bacterium]